METKKLPVQREAFCQAYIKTENQTAAYRVAFKCDNVKPQALAERASKLMKNADIKTRIIELKELTKNVANVKFQITAESILRQLDAIRRSNIMDYLELKKVRKTTTSAKGKKTTQIVQEFRFKDFSKLTPEQLGCIESAEQTRTGPRIKLNGKEWAIEKINKHIGFYEIDNDQKSKIFDSPEARDIRIKELMKKAAEL